MTVERKPKSVEGAHVAVHPNSTPQGGLPALPRFTGMHARECVLIVASWHIARAALRLSAAKKVRIYTGGNTADLLHAAVADHRGDGDAAHLGAVAGNHFTAFCGGAPLGCSPEARRRGFARGPICR